MEAYPGLLNNMSPSALQRIRSLELSERNYYIFDKEANLEQNGNALPFKDGGGVLYFDLNKAETFAHEVAGHGAQFEANSVLGNIGAKWLSSYCNDIEFRVGMESDAVTISGNEWGMSEELEYGNTGGGYDIKVANENDVLGQVE